MDFDAALPSLHCRLTGALALCKAIAISHPHYYSNLAEWAEIFRCPVRLPVADKRWVLRPSDRVNFWTGAPSWPTARGSLQGQDRTRAQLPCLPVKGSCSLVALSCAACR